MTLTTYHRDEIISATEFARHLKRLLNELRSKKKEKIAISRHNKIEAVLITPETLEELMEHLEIYKIVKKTKSAKRSKKFISLESLEKEYGL